MIAGVAILATVASACDPSHTKTYGESKDAPAPIVMVELSPAKVAAFSTVPTTADVSPPVVGDALTTEAELPELTRHRINDLVAIAQAVEAYKADTGKYPDSGGGWAAYKMSWGQSKGANWIPQLVPKYMKSVPREPTRSENPDGPQYLYASDGTYFKIIAHYSGDCDVAIKSPRVQQDPIRVYPNGSCWAYGIWSAEGRRY